MINRFFFLFLAVMLFSLSITTIASADAPSYSYHDTYTQHTPEPKPASLNDSYQIASVCFLGINCGNNSGYSKDQGGSYYEQDLENMCKSSGFKKTGECPASQIKGKLCPVNPAYFDQCCDADFQFSSKNCSYPNTLSSSSCSGKHKCLCDRRLFPVTECLAEEVFKDNNSYCDEISYRTGTPVTTRYYSGCKCPDNYRICGKNQEGVGDVCRENYFTDCKCASGFNLECLDYGPAKGQENNYCLSNGTKYYNSCKSSDDICLDQGYTKTNCAADEVIAEYCSVNSLYHTCKTATCRDQILANGNYNTDSNGVIYSITSPTTAYVVEDTQQMPLINTKTGSPFNTIYGPSNVNFAACKNTPTPTITVKSAQSPSVLDRSINNLNLKLASSSYNINGTSKLYNVKISSTYNPSINIKYGALLYISGETSSNPGLTVNVENGGYASIDGPSSSAKKTDPVKNFNIHFGGEGYATNYTTIGYYNIDGLGQIGSNAAVTNVKIAPRGALHITGSNSYLDTVTVSSDSAVTAANLFIYDYVNVTMRVLAIRESGKLRINHGATLTVKDNLSLYLENSNSDGWWTMMCLYLPSNSNYSAATIKYKNVSYTGNTSKLRSFRVNKDWVPLPTDQFTSTSSDGNNKWCSAGAVSNDAKKCDAKNNWFPINGTNWNYSTAAHWKYY